MMHVFDPVVILRPEMVEVGEHARIDSFVKIEGGQGVRIGAHVHIASFAHIGIGGGSVDVGEHVAIASGAKILSGSNTTKGVSMSAASPSEMQVVERRHTVIGPYAFIGVGAIVFPGVVVGAGAVIGAGAVVTRNVPPGEIWVGNPARRLSERE